MVLGYIVKCLCVSPTEDLLIALTDDLLLYSYQLKKKEGAQVRVNNGFLEIHKNFFFCAGEEKCVFDSTPSIS